MASPVVNWKSTQLIKKNPFIPLLGLQDTSNLVGELLRGGGLLPPPPEAPEAKRSQIPTSLWDKGQS